MGAGAHETVGVDENGTGVVETNKEISRRKKETITRRIYIMLFC
jgi:hypothetical protein